MIQQFDDINQLPIDKNKPEHNELVIVNELFKNEAQLKIIANEFKSTILLGLLFILFSNSYTNDLFKKYIKGTDIYRLISKTLLIMICFWVLNNFCFSRK